MSSIPLVNQIFSGLMEKPELSQLLSEILQVTAYGDPKLAISNNLSGYDHRQTGSPVPIDRSASGLTFFTRPLMNLTSENIIPVNYLTNLLTTDEYSYNRYIRCVLDVRLASQGITTPLFNNLQAFIPLLGNSVLSLSGFPDHVNSVRYAKQGNARQTWMMYDSIPEIYYNYSLSINFRELRGKPITALLLSWLYVGGYSFYGRVLPYLDTQLRKEINYQTRIYRIIFDHTKTRVQEIMCSGVSMPESVPTGRQGDFDVSSPMNESSREISTTWPSIGFFYNQPFIMKEFNSVVCMFNRAMADNYREKYYRKVPSDLLEAFNFERDAFPRINLDTAEFEWWAPHSLVAEKSRRVKGK